jgi:hypothetical protein
MITPLRRNLARFARDDEGSAIVETVITLPLLIWAYVALFVYWDAYKSENTAVKASYTIADMVSRNMEVNTTYLGGLHDVFDYLLASDMETGLVVTNVFWNEAEDKYEVLWSQAYGEGINGMSNARLNSMSSSLPDMSDGDTVILVETSVNYDAPFSVGVPDFEYEQAIFTRPRMTGNIECNDCRQGGYPDDSNGVVDVPGEDAGGADEDLIVPGTY